MLINFPVPIAIIPFTQQGSGDPEAHRAALPAAFAIRLTLSLV